MVHYLIQVVVFQLAFLLVYELLFRQQSFFRLNRIYLLLTSILALILPFVKLSFLSGFAGNYGVITFPELVLGTTPITELSEMSETVMEAAGIATTDPATPLWQLVLLWGRIFFGLILVINGLRLLLIRTKNPKRWRDNVLIVNLKDSFQAFSFFNTIYLGSKIPVGDRDLVLEHELVHVRHWHSLDILWFQLMRVVLWFNPAVYWYHSRMTEIHEFTADQIILSSERKTSYYKNLLRQVFEVPSVALTNSFFSRSLIKKRIQMIQKSKSKTVNLWRYAALLPLIFMMLTYVSCEQEITEEVNSIESQLKDMEISTTSDNIKDPMISQKIDKMVDFVNANPEYVVFMDADFEGDNLKVQVVHKSNLPEKHTKLGSELVGTELYIGLPKGKTPNIQNYEEKEEVPFAVIDQVPTFESCAHLDGEERKKCTSQKVAMFVNRNFNTDLANQLGLVGRQRIYVSFKIDKQGKVVDIGARAPHPELELEAERVIGELPKFIPGVHRGEPVTVPYSLPILFQVSE